MLNSKHAYINVLRQTKEYYPLIFIYSICISVLTLATPISVQSLVNTFSFIPYFQPLFIISLLLLSLLIVLGLFKSLQYLLVEHLQRKLYARLASQITHFYLIKDELSKKDVSVANRYFDIISLQKTLAYLVTDGMAVILQMVFGLSLISIYHPFFILLSFLIIVCLIGPIWFFGSMAMATASDESTAKYDVADFIESIAVKKNDVTVSDVDRKIVEFLKIREKHFRILFLQNIIYACLFATLNAVLLGLGGYLVITSQLSVGQLVAAEIVVNSILIHFLYAKKYLESFYDMYAASEKIKIFYGKSFDSLSQPQNYKFKKIIYTPENYKIILKYFSVGSVVFLMLIFITPWQQTSRGYGKVTALNPNDRIQFITSNVSGRIEEWLIKDGQIVRKGDPIVRVVDNDPNFLDRLEQQRDTAIKKFDAAKEASNTAQLNYHRQKQLVKEGLSSPKEFEEAKIKFKNLLASEAKTTAELTDTEVALSRQQLQLIEAPKNGRILRILHGSGSVNIKEGDPLVKFVPDTEESVVEVFIDGNDLPLIFPGREVRIQFEGWPSVQFSGWPSVAIGSFGGIVSVVDPSVSDDGQFRVLVVPNLEDLNSWPDQRFLRQGSRAIALVLLDQVSIGYEIWRKVNGFPKSMDSTPNYNDQKEREQIK